MIKELAIWLTGRVAGLTIGGNLQVGWRASDAPLRCHAMSETGGSAFFDLPDRADVTIQIFTRANTYQTARADAWAIYNAIHGTAGWQVAAESSGGQAYIAQTVEALALPQFIGQDADAQGAFEFSTNYIFRMVKA